MYYGNVERATGMYSRVATLDEAEDAFRAEFIKTDRIATDLDNVVRRTAAMDANYELSKIRWAAAGHNAYSAETEMERLEFGKPMPADPRYDSPDHFTSLAQVFPDLTRGAADAA